MPLRTRSIVLLLLALTACSSAPVQKKPQRSSRPLPAVTVQIDPDNNKKPGAYHLDDGPGTAPVDISSIPEPVPIDEPELPRANQPYTVEGEVVSPVHGRYAYSARGIASWYGKRFHGRKTASGERYDMYAFSAAHRTLPIPSYARVTNLKNGKSVVVRVNDRGPFHKKRMLDLSYAAAVKLDFVNSGEASVLVERVLPGGRPLPPAPAPEEDIAVNSVTDLQQDKVYLQLGSFKKASSARALFTRMKAHPDNGAPLILLQHNGNSRVLCGPYDDEGSARDAMRGLREKTGRPTVLYRPTAVVAQR